MERDRGNGRSVWHHVCFCFSTPFDVTAWQIGCRIACGGALYALLFGSTKHPPPLLTASPLRTAVGVARVWLIVAALTFIRGFIGQGRDLSVFCRLWLVNRTEMVLQHRDSSLAGGIDSTFMGDRMPQITQPGRQETTGAEGGGGGVGVVDYRLHRSASVGTGALTPTKVGEVDFPWGNIGFGV